MPRKSNNQIQEEQSERVINDNTKCEVMNFTNSNLFYRNPSTNEEWDLMGFGARSKMRVSDLEKIYSNSQSKRIIDEGWLLILDEDVINYLHLDRLYENIIKPDDLEALFKLDEEKTKDIVSKSPSGVKLLIAQKAKEKIKNKDFVMDSRHKVELFETALGFSLSDDVK